MEKPTRFLRSLVQDETMKLNYASNICPKQRLRKAIQFKQSYVNIQ